MYSITEANYRNGKDKQTKTEAENGEKFFKKIIEHT